MQQAKRPRVVTTLKAKNKNKLTHYLISSLTVQLQIIKAVCYQQKNRLIDQTIGERIEKQTHTYVQQNLEKVLKIITGDRVFSVNVAMNNYVSLKKKKKP